MTSPLTRLQPGRIRLKKYAYRISISFSGCHGQAEVRTFLQMLNAHFSQRKGYLGGAHMFKGLAGKSAIVTGGATLIGTAVVRALHESGVAVTLADIDLAKGREVAESCGNNA